MQTDKVEVCLATNQGLKQLTQTILHHTSAVNFLTLRPQLVEDLHKLQRENLNALCHTQRSVFSFAEGQKMLNFDSMGSIIAGQEKVLSGVQLRPVQKPHIRAVVPHQRTHQWLKIRCLCYIRR